MTRLAALLFAVALVFTASPARAETVVSDDRQATAEFQRTEKCTVATMTVQVTDYITPDTRDRFATISYQEYYKADPRCPGGDPIIHDLSTTTEDFNQSFDPETRTASIGGAALFYDNHSGTSRTLRFAVTWKAQTVRKRVDGNTTTWVAPSRACGKLGDASEVLFDGCTANAQLTRTKTVE